MVVNGSREGNRITPPFEDVTYAIIGAAMAVHNEIGPGLKESVYHRAMRIELEKRGLPFELERDVEIQLDGVTIGLLYLDLLVSEAVVVEIKALSHLMTEEEKAQVITYLGATGLPVGLLINFGRRYLEYKRLFPPRDLKAWTHRINRYIWNPAKL
jgi:GxxExxY protein